MIKGQFDFVGCLVNEPDSDLSNSGHGALNRRSQWNENVTSLVDWGDQNGR